jgi:hypothetical protein
MNKFYNSLTKLEAEYINSNIFDLVSILSYFEYLLKFNGPIWLSFGEGSIYRFH